MRYSVAITSSAHDTLKRHLIRDDGQEDVCYALWAPGAGRDRYTGLVTDVVLPRDGERLVHGNASTTGEFLTRASDFARARQRGLAFLHSHPFPGWQDMSHDDRTTELRQAAAVRGATGLPLLGLTIGTDAAWSARFWIKGAPKQYTRQWCESVRVIGDNGLDVTYHPELLPSPAFREELKRTVSAWGESAQQRLARLRFGVVGVGSVGSIVAECLARMGIQEVRLIDYDRVARHNLDRLLHATSADATARRRKIDVIGEALRRGATAAKPNIEGLPLAVTEEDGFRAALDCDIIFSCVDRPWARHVLNYIAYAYLIPVVDGGIVIRQSKGRLRHASWKSHAVYPGKRCMQCNGQYDPDAVNVERRGDLEDPTYIETLPIEHPLRRNENVFPFSAHLASSHVMQALHVALKPVGIADIGEQIYHFVDGTIDISQGMKCEDGCYFTSVAGHGDAAALPITGTDLTAAKMRTPTGGNGLPRRIAAWIGKALRPS